MSGFDIFAIAFVLLVIFTLFAGVKTVSQGYDWTIERFGKYTRTLSPGLNIIVPYFDRVGRKMNMMEQVIDIPEQEVITKDKDLALLEPYGLQRVFDFRTAAASHFSPDGLSTMRVRYRPVFSFRTCSIQHTCQSCCANKYTLTWRSLQLQ